MFVLLSISTLCLDVYGMMFSIVLIGMFVTHDGMSLRLEGF